MLLVTSTQKGFQKVEVEHLKPNDNMFSGKKTASSTSFVTNLLCDLGLGQLPYWILSFLTYKIKGVES